MPATENDKEFAYPLLKRYNLGKCNFRCFNILTLYNKNNENIIKFYF